MAVHADRGMGSGPDCGNIACFIIAAVATAGQGARRARGRVRRATAGRRRELGSLLHGLRIECPCTLCGLLVVGAGRGTLEVARHGRVNVDGVDEVASLPAVAHAVEVVVRTVRQRAVVPHHRATGTFFYNAPSS